MESRDRNTHAQCFDCWVRERAAWKDGSIAIPQPHRLVQAQPERCCGCGRWTLAGIYVRSAMRACMFKGDHDEPAGEMKAGSAQEAVEAVAAAAACAKGRPN